MNTEQDTYELIDSYLNGELAADHPFVEKLRHDADLAQEVELQQLVREAVIDHRLTAVSKVIDGYRGKPIPTNKWKWWTISGAVILIGIGIGVYLNTKRSSIITQQLPKKEIVTAKRNEDIQISAQPKTPKIEPIAKYKQALGQLEPAAQAPIAIQKEELATLTAVEKTPVMQEKSINSASSQHLETKHIPLPDPCANVHLSARIASEQPCGTNHNGSIRIDNLQGGTSPYKYSLDHGKSYQDGNEFFHLPEGQYTVTARDAKGCGNVLQNHYSLTSKKCHEFKEYDFNPHQSPWEIPVDVSKNGEVEIWNRSGQLIFQRPFQANDRIAWDGNSQTGQTLAPGVYIYSLKYADGSMEQGNITIVY